MNSKKIYARAWATLKCFLQTRRFQPDANILPLTTSEVILFITYLHQVGYAHSTIMTYISAIAFVHKLSNHPDPSQTFLVKKLLESVKKNSSPVQRRLPITLPLLKELLNEVDRLYQGRKRLMLKSWFSLAFHICARVGELAVSNSNQNNVIRCNQVSLVKKGGQIVRVTVNFHHHKHKDPTDVAVRTVLPMKGPYCPISLLLDYLKCRGSKPGPLFVKGNHQPVKSSDISQALSSCLASLGLDPTHYGTHSFRIGGATEAAQKGASDAQLRLIGRWKSNAFLSYVRPQSFVFQY